MSLPRPPSIFDDGDLRDAFARRGAPTAHNLGSPESEALRELIVDIEARIRRLEAHEARIRKLEAHEVFQYPLVACCPGPPVGEDELAATTIAGGLHYLAHSLKVMEQRHAHTATVLKGLLGEDRYQPPEITLHQNPRHDPCAKLV